MTRAVLLAVGGLLTATLTACSGPPDAEYEPPRVVSATYTETGDFSDIERRGKLRLLVVRHHATPDHLPRAGSPTAEQLRAAAGFARTIGLEPVVVLVDDDDELIPALRDGRGDVIVANLLATPERRESIAFSVALDRSREMLVARADDPVESPGDLAGRTLTVPYQTHLWETARQLQDGVANLYVDSLPALTDERRLDLLEEGRIDLTLVDSNVLDRVLPHRPDLRAVFPVRQETGVSWGLRPDADQLKAMLDRFIVQHQLVQREQDLRTDDLPGIRDARTLRVVTRNSAANYFVWRGQLLGFEYELARRFADQLGVRLEVVVADDAESILPMLQAGEADIAAAFLTAEQHEDYDIAWSRPYHHAVRQVVTQRRQHGIETIADLAGRTFHVRENSDAWRKLHRLDEAHDLGLRIRAVPPDEEPETTIARVGRGQYDLTLADDHIVSNAMVWHDNIVPVLNIGDPVAHHWAVRRGNEQLLAAVDEYLAGIYRSEFYNVNYAKYFRDHERIQGFQAHRIDLGIEDGRQLSPYDELVRDYAEEYGIDWRLVVAQMFQESGFDPNARSWIGAVGLMQLMPRTAGQLGVDGDLTDPEINIRAGIRYMDWLRDRFEDDLRVHDRMWFMLAAYNAGIGHVRDARRLAASLGLDPNQWFGNVEVAMEKLSERRYFQHARFGYVRGHEPVGYVRSIRERYQAYILWTEDCWPTCRDSPHPGTLDFQPPGGLIQAAH